MLPTTGAHGAIALFQSFNQISTRTLPCGVTAHAPAGQQEKQESKDGAGPVQADAALDWHGVAGHFRNNVHDPERETQPNSSGDEAYGGAFQNEQSNDT